MGLIAIKSPTNNSTDSTDPYQRILRPSSHAFVETASRTATVLHVDDEPDFADMAKIFLERAQETFEVVTAYNTTEALTILDEEDIDGIISDYQMPNMDGIELLKHVREQAPELPFILCTARGSEEVASEAIAAGVTDYIQKGTDTKQYEILANRVENAIVQYRTEEQLWETLRWSERLLTQSLLGVYIVQNDRFVFVNDVFARLFGYTPQELLEQRPSVLSIDAPTSEATSTCLNAIPDDAETARYRTKGQSRTGCQVECIIELSTIAFKGESAVLGVVRDSDGGEPPPASREDEASLTRRRHPSTDEDGGSMNG